MEWVEVTGKTVEEAKDAALDQLGVDEHDAEFEILEEPKGGLFGRLRSEARVRARVSPTAPPPKAGRRDRSRQRGRERPASPAPAPRSAQGSEDDLAEAPASNTSSTGRAARPERARSTSEENGRAPVDPQVAREEATAAATQFLTGLTKVLDLEAAVNTETIDDETIEVSVDGEELGLLIGPRGQTLLALQELTRTAAARQTGGFHCRIMVDVSGYRKKRREALSRFVKEVAAEVVESQVARELEPMVAADRKVVHDTVNELDGVITASEGEEPRRRVVILPGEREG